MSRQGQAVQRYWGDFGSDELIPRNDLIVMLVTECALSGSGFVVGGVFLGWGGGYLVLDGGRCKTWGG